MVTKVRKEKKHSEQPHEIDLDFYVKAALGRKAGKLVVMDLRGLSSITDYFIICSAKSARQSEAIADYIRAEIRTAGMKCLSADGIKEGQWVVLDYGDVMIHIFYEPVRDFYDLEGLWIDAPRIMTQAIKEAAEKGDESVLGIYGGSGDEW